MPTAPSGSLSRAPTTSPPRAAPAEEEDPRFSANDKLPRIASLAAAAAPPPRRRQRSLTWPLLLRRGIPQNPEDDHVSLPLINTKACYDSPSASSSDCSSDDTVRPTHPQPQSPSTNDAFLHDLNSHPEHHFLAPIAMYEYEDWASSDSDASDDEIEWDAGITDFALFDSDRRQAEERQEPLPSRWRGMLENQTSALRRAQDRRNTAARADPRFLFTPAADDDEEGDLPHLTPDNSPDMRDDLDVVDSFHGHGETRPPVPRYLTIRLSPPSSDDGEEAREFCSPSDAELLRLQAQKRRQQRPGLRHSRTMSGQTHAWRRPSRGMYTLGEEPDREAREELAQGAGCCDECAFGEAMRGRK